jgi:hypothetical protein
MDKKVQICGPSMFRLCKQVPQPCICPPFSRNAFTCATKSAFSFTRLLLPPLLQEETHEQCHPFHVFFMPEECAPVDVQFSGKVTGTSFFTVNQQLF